MKQIFTISILSVFLISCGLHSKVTRKQITTPLPVVDHIKHDVPLSTGVNFETGKIVSLDPLTGKKIKPCGIIVEDVASLASAKHKYKNTDDDDCDFEIVTSNNPSLASALKSSKSIIKGTVRKGGKIIPAYFVLEVRGQWEGSNCSSSSAGGSTSANCISKQQKCAALPWLPGC